MRYLTCFLLIFVIPVFGQDPRDPILELSPKADPIPTEEEIKKNPSSLSGVDSFTLPNGLKIIIRPNPISTSVKMILFAGGGSYSLPEGSDTAAKYAGTFALQSGYGDLTADTLNEIFFRYSIELTARTRPFHRHIDLNCPQESLSRTLAILHHFFLDMKPEEEGVKKTIQRIENTMLKRSKNCESLFEDIYLTLNSGGHSAMRPTTQEQLRATSLETIQEVFHLSFLDPSEFTLIVVGSTTKEELIPLALRYLGTIPKPKSSFNWDPTHPKLSFPRGSLKRSVDCKISHNEEQIRITFPVRFPLDQENYPQFEVCTQLIESRLRESMTSTYQSNQAIDIQYHLPVYPYIDTVWVTIQFRCSNDQTEAITKRCFKELQLLSDNGVNDHEIEQIRSLFTRLNAYWLQEDDYWLQAMTNYTFWRWQLRCIEDSCSVQQLFSKEEINLFLKKLILLNDHTTIILRS